MKILSLIPTKLPQILKYLKRCRWTTSLTKKMAASYSLEGGIYPKRVLSTEFSIQKVEAVYINYHSMSESSEKTKVSNVCFLSVWRFDCDFCIFL